MKTRLKNGLRSVFRSGLVALALLLWLAGGRLDAGSATWQLNPASGVWNTVTNWSPATVPNGPADTATFGLSNTTGLSISADTEVNGIVFGTGASAFTITASSAFKLTLSGMGITNNSGLAQTFVAAVDGAGHSGRIDFLNSATAGINTAFTANGATVDINTVSSTVGGLTRFSTTSTAGAATFITIGGTVFGAPGGTTEFFDSSTASSGAFTNNGGTAFGSGGGITLFHDTSTAGSATFINNGGAVDGTSGGYVQFYNASTAGMATFTNKGAAVAGAGASTTQFFDTSNAGSGTFTTIGSTISGQNGGFTQFFNMSSAGSGSFTTNGGTVSGTNGGTTEFYATSNAGNGIFTNTGGAVSGANGGLTEFYDSSTAANGVFTSNGGAVSGARGAITRFRNTSTAGNATLIANGGTGGGDGGAIFFIENSTGGTARAEIFGNGKLDISGQNSPGVTIGSIEGTGNVFLGSKSLSVGSNNLSTVFSGVVQGGGALTKIGTGALTLSGVNTYTGATAVNAGALIVNGALDAASAVSVENGATLGGSGAVSGAVTIKDGGILAPGTASPGTLTLGSLMLNPASNLNFRLGPPDVVGGASNDLLQVTGSLTLDGILNVANSGGFGMGTYRLINYGGALTDNGLGIGVVPAGFNAGDFTIQTSVANQVNLVVGASTVLHWDGAQTVANGAVEGGSGEWNAATTNWTTASGATNSAWNNKFAIFSGAAGGAVTLKESVSTTGMQFATNGYTIGADPGAAITLAGATTFRVDPGVAATINAPLIGSGSLRKNDGGTLTLSGNSTFSGHFFVISGDLVIRNPTGMGLGAGSADVFTGGRLLFAGNALAGANTIFVDPSPTNSIGGQLVFSNTASAGAATIQQLGSTLSNVNTVAQTTFFDSSSAGDATFTNFGGQANNSAHGGTIDFRGSSTAGNATINNHGAEIAGANSGFISFLDSSTAGAARITNFGTGTKTAFGADNGGGLSFNAQAKAGNATILNQGVTAANGSPGATTFRETSTADRASITNAGATATFAIGGSTRFLGQATAGDSVILNARGAAFFAYGGTTSLFDSASAGNSVVTTQGASYPGGVYVVYGITDFHDTSSAGAGTFFNESGVGGGAYTQFFDTAMAGTARFDNEGGRETNSTGGSVYFTASASADRAVITNHGIAADGAYFGGVAYFEKLSKAGTAVIVNEGSAFSAGGGAMAIAGGSATFTNTASADHATITNAGGTANGGVTKFSADSTAASATIFNGGAQGNFNSQANTYFFDHTSAADASITNVGGAVSNGFGGTTTFNGLDLVTPATATRATLTNRGAAVSGAFGGSAHFDSYATAGNSIILNQGATAPGAPPGAAGFALNYAAGNTLFATNTGAGDGTITNEPGAVVNAYGGNTNFSDGSSAQRANILNAGAALPATAPGSTRFFNGAKAGTATITNTGATAANADGGLTQFYNNSSADSGVFHTLGGTVDGAGSGQIQFHDTSFGGAATLYAEAGTGTAAGGAIIFFDFANGGTARVILAGGGASGGGLDISQSSSGGVGIGSIEGGGVVSLGSKVLLVGTNNLSTTFSGQIRDGGFVNATGGILTKSGKGQLTLSGANTYTGNTTVADGVLIVQNAAGTGLGSGPVTVLGTATSELRFAETASAGAVAITNVGSAALLPGLTNFTITATAGSAQITNQTNRANGGVGGLTQYYNSSNAGNATISNAGALFAGPGGGNHYGAGETYFFDNASAASASLTNFGGLAASREGGKTFFYGAGATAGSSTITNQDGAVSGALSGQTLFSGTATAGNGTINNRGGQTTGTQGGTTQFLNNATAGRESITNFGAAASGASGGTTQFFNSASAGFATLTTHGAIILSASRGGLLQFNDQSTASGATLITNGGTNGGAGGRTLFLNTSSGGAARLITNAGGLVDISSLASAGTTVGSIEGAGGYFLGAKKLTVIGYTPPPANAPAANARANALAANDAGAAVFEVSGEISGDAGSLEIGAPITLILSGANTYTGPTTVSSAGATLQVEGSLASNSISVVNGGTLAGHGVLAGALTIGEPAGGASGTLSPGDGIATFSTGGSLTLEATAVFQLEINSDTREADEIIANGLTLAAGASLDTFDFGTTPLPAGLVFTIADNMSPNPVTGFFNGLSEGAQLGIGSREFAISYRGGTGNDVTLTSVPEPSATFLLLAAAGWLARRRPGDPTRK